MVWRCTTWLWQIITNGWFIIWGVFYFCNLEIILMVLNMVKENLFGKMVMFIKVILIIIRFKGMARWHLAEVRFIQGNGQITKWMEEVYFNGLMVEGTKVNFQTIKEMDMVYCNRVMVAYMKDISSKVFNMVKEKWKIRMNNG